MVIQCNDCGCPHTTIKRHVQWNGLKFFLAERTCDNCANTWMSLEPVSNLQQQQGKYFKDTNQEERELDAEAFEKPEDIQDHTVSVNKQSSDLLVILVDEIKDLKIIINNTNKKVKELTSLIKKFEIKNDNK